MQQRIVEQPGLDTLARENLLPVLGEGAASKRCATEVLRPKSSKQPNLHDENLHEPLSPLTSSSSSGSLQLSQVLMSSRSWPVMQYLQRH